MPGKNSAYFVYRITPSASHAKVPPATRRVASMSKRSASPPKIQRSGERMPRRYEIVGDKIVTYKPIARPPKASSQSYHGTESPVCLECGLTARKTLPSAKAKNKARYCCLKKVTSK